MVLISLYRNISVLHSVFLYLKLHWEKHDEKFDTKMNCLGVTIQRTMWLLHLHLGAISSYSGIPKTIFVFECVTTEATKRWIDSKKICFNSGFLAQNRVGVPLIGYIT